MSRIEHDGPVADPKHWLRVFASLFTGARQLWKTQGNRRVMWIDGRAPDSEEAAAIWEAVAKRGCRTYETVARCAADLLFRRDLAAGGWLADIGLVYPWYVLLVRENLERFRGRLVWIEDEAETKPWS
jgi:hypothetical protein